MENSQIIEKFRKIAEERNWEIADIEVTEVPNCKTRKHLHAYLYECLLNVNDITTLVKEFKDTSIIVGGSWRKFYYRPTTMISIITEAS